MKNYLERAGSNSMEIVNSVIETNYYNSGTRIVINNKDNFLKKYINENFFNNLEFYTLPWSFYDDEKKSKLSGNTISDFYICLDNTSNTY